MNDLICTRVRTCVSPERKRNRPHVSSMVHARSILMPLKLRNSSWNVCEHDTVEIPDSSQISIQSVMILLQLNIPCRVRKQSDLIELS